MFWHFYVFLAVGLLELAVALDEREYDAAVAPAQPLASVRPWQLWRSFTSQLRLRTRDILTRFQLIAPLPQAAPVAITKQTIVKTKMHTITTTEAALQYYGALNPIFQQGTY